jgi:hypothetical protein
LVAFFFVAFFAALRFFAMFGSFYWLRYCLVCITCLDSVRPSALSWG